MRWLVNALSTTIGQKYLMAMTGLALCGFLAAHLAGNLFLFVGPAAYNAYAAKLHKNEGLLMVAETGLFAVFLVHFVLAFLAVRRNRGARNQAYATKQTKQDGKVLGGGGASAWMVGTGVLVLLFLMLHLVDFKMELRPDVDTAGRTAFAKAVLLLNNPVTAIGYVLGCGFLGVHLAHGFASAFQSLGINHPKYNGWINCIGLLFAWVIAIGFMSCVFWALMLPDNVVQEAASSMVDH